MLVTSEQSISGSLNDLAPTGISNAVPLLITDLKESNKEETRSQTPDFLSFVKSLDMDKIEEGINSLQRVLGVISEMAIKNTNETPKYKPRPLYKHFDD